MLTVGIDEVGYGPSLGPLVVAAAAARGPLRAPVAVADSKKIFSQARGVRSLEPAVLGYVPAKTFRDLLRRLGAELPGSPWYGEDVELPFYPTWETLAGSWAVVVDPAEFNARTRERNKSDLLFELATGLINRIRAAHPEPIRFVVGKQGGRRFYAKGLRALVAPEVEIHEESRGRSAYALPGAMIEFLRDAEDRHELVALASMIGKYVRERAMGLFNAWWTSKIDGLRPTAGYGTDGKRFWKEIAGAVDRLGLPRENVLRLR